jgi:hypothetical protein
MEMPQFLKRYLELTREITRAVETDQWQGAWLLTRERERFCRRWLGLSTNLEDGDLPTLSLQGDRGAVRALFAEAQAADLRCINLIRSRLDKVGQQLRELHTYRRWNGLRRVFPGPESRLVNAAG